MSSISEITTPRDSRTLKDILAQQLLIHSRSEKLGVIRSAMEHTDRDALLRIMISLGFQHDPRQFHADSHALTNMDWWEIAYQPHPPSQAYTHSNTRQPLHCDNAWFSDGPELNLFVMEKQAPTGGEQVLYPVSLLLADLKRDQPALLKLLVETAVVIRKGDEPGVWNDTPILTLGPQPKVFWNYYRIQKDTSKVADMCERFFQFLEERMLSGDLPQLRAEDGDLFFFNDQLVLHGRMAFEAAELAARVLLQSSWKLPDCALRGQNHN